MRIWRAVWISTGSLLFPSNSAGRAILAEEVRYLELANDSFCICILNFKMASVGMRFLEKLFFETVHFRVVYSPVVILENLQPFRLQLLKFYSRSFECLYSTRKLRNSDVSQPSCNAKHSGSFQLLRQFLKIA